MAAAAKPKEKEKPKEREKPKEKPKERDKPQEQERENPKDKEPRDVGRQMAPDPDEPPKGGMESLPSLNKVGQGTIE